MKQVDDSTLLIVGNGFDINLGLDTSYASFLESSYFIKLYDDASEESLFAYLHYKYQIQKWVDVEKELENYCSEIDQLDDTKVKQLLKEYASLCSALKLFILEVSSSSIYQSSEKSSVQLIMDLKCHKSPLSKINIVTFNYTDSIEKILGYDYCSDIANILHIHGTCKLSDQIVFGVQDTAALFKEIQRIYKSSNPRTQAYEFNKMLMQSNHIIFYGYSLGETDHTYFSDFFSSLLREGADKRLTFFYYNEQAKEDILWELRTLAHGKFGELSMRNTIKFINCNKYKSPLPDFELDI